jgi:hypothetical protein
MFARRLKPRRWSFTLTLRSGESAPVTLLQSSFRFRRHANSLHCLGSLNRQDLEERSPPTAGAIIKVANNHPPNRAAQL